MIIAIEGGVCSGKTTLCNKLNKKSFFMIPEYMEIITPEENKIVKQRNALGDTSLDIFFEVEKRRLQMLKNNSNDRDIVLDRSFLTLFAYEFAKNGNDFSHLAQKSETLSNLIVPDLIIFLDVDPKERELRSSNRGDKDMPAFFLNEEFNTKLKSYFKEYVDVKKIFCNTNTLSSEQIANVIMDINGVQEQNKFNFGLYKEKLQRY